MSNIVNTDYDNWDSTIWTEIFSETPLGMYFYLVSQEELQNLGGIIGNCNAIHSCYYAPFLETNGMTLYKIPYDVERFGKAVGSIDTTPNVFRIADLGIQSQSLGTYDKYKINRPSGNLRNWRNESRLYNFPYASCMLTDHINLPLEFAVTDILPYGLGNQMSFYAKAFLTDKGTYCIGVTNLKGDFGGRIECAISSSPTEIPVSSSAYANWSSTQKAQTNQQLMNNIQSLSQSNAFTQENIGLERTRSGANALLGGASNLGGAIGNVMTGNIGGAIGNLGSLFGSGVNYGLNQQGLTMKSEHSNRQFQLGQKQAIGTKNAYIKDLQNTPRTMMSTGSDVLFSMNLGNQKLSLLRYGLTEKYYERLGDYFAQFGYAQNRMMTINLRSRLNYNYIKTVGANIISKPSASKRIPKDHLRRLTEIFDNGVTIWHIDRNGNQFQDYSKDNVEMN